MLKYEMQRTEKLNYLTDPPFSFTQKMHNSPFAENTMQQKQYAMTSVVEQ